MPSNARAVRVLVIGAGPGGASAAVELARGGADVVLAERSAWPREKTCGDGISPPGVAIASELGVDLTDRLALREGEISTPAGAVFRGGWRPSTPWGTIVPRREFDDRLVRAAVAAGARFETRTRVSGVRRERGGIAARLGSASGEPERFAAVVVAEGATGGIAAALGFGRHRSRLVALRGYAPAAIALDPVFGLYFDRGVSPGYGWIFPLESGRANVGLLVDERAVRRRNGDLRGMLRAWLAASAIARERLDAAPVLERLAGGVIPSGRARRVRDGAYLVGDAAGVADPFSAEGIYQAMASGREAARALLRLGPGARAEAAYRRALRPFDRNDAEARRLRLGFGAVIDVLGRRALTRPALANHLSATGFFMKESLPGFLAGIVRTW